MARILITTDDLETQELLYNHLSQANFNVILFASFTDILQRVLQGGIDLIVLDLPLSESDNFELCQKIRQITKIPLIVSSVNNDVSCKIRYFEEGADDYITKPYDLRELMARIRALLRRIEPREMVFGFLNVDAKRRIAKLHNQNLELTNTEFDILLFLIENRLQPISRDRIAHTINAIHEDTGLRSIDTHIRNLRNKLGDSAKEPKYIQSVWGVGYKFCL